MTKVKLLRAAAQFTSDKLTRPVTSTLEHDAITRAFGTVRAIRADVILSGGAHYPPSQVHPCSAEDRHRIGGADAPARAR